MAFPHAIPVKSPIPLIFHPLPLCLWWF